jgi:hypothetical protein
MRFDVAHPTGVASMAGTAHPRSAHPRSVPSGHAVRTIVAVVIGCTLAVLGLMISSPVAAGAATPHITVTPSSGLSNGQTVTVHGTGYSANVKNINIIQCPVSGASQNSCNVPDAKIFQSSDGSGSFTVQLVVRSTINGVDCTKVACMIDAHEGTSATSGNDSSVIIHFGSAPSTHSSTPGGSNGGSSNTGSNNGTGTGGGSTTTPGSGNPTGANTGYQDIGTPRITTTLVLIGIGAVLLVTGTMLHLRRRREVK